jgi:hypothetical protein
MPTDPASYRPHRLRCDRRGGRGEAVPPRPAFHPPLALPVDQITVGARGGGKGRGGEGGGGGGQAEAAQGQAQAQSHGSGDAPRSPPPAPARRGADRAQGARRLGAGILSLGPSRAWGGLTPRTSWQHPLDDGRGGCG